MPYRENPVVDSLHWYCEKKYPLIVLWCIKIFSGQLVSQLNLNGAMHKDSFCYSLGFWSQTLKYVFRLGKYLR